MAPSPRTLDIQEELRTAAQDLATLLVKLTPESREQSLALTALDELYFWANAAVARRGADHDKEDIERQRQERAKAAEQQRVPEAKWGMAPMAE